MVIGDFSQAGFLSAKEAIEIFDEEFNIFYTKKVVLYFIYDVEVNTTCINLGSNHDTSKFACDILRHWWYRHGQHQYPDATSILMLCDGGDSNSAHHGSTCNSMFRKPGSETLQEST
ncbi:hypothetical protein EYB53_004060 [Candidatus Chloroploca sp. M-50]|uniref:Uncharacterized protein n=1 Tax=Candidatus Chloroploca mongolica TaxID=2528176 RepID=A0ABS4D614_9CHLR|nr:hypothetical protein [Candidatus Chloroploca mongolica]